MMAAVHRGDHNAFAGMCENTGGEMEFRFGFPFSGDVFSDALKTNGVALRVEKSAVGPLVAGGAFPGALKPLLVGFQGFFRRQRCQP